MKIKVKAIPAIETYYHNDVTYPGVGSEYWAKDLIFISPDKKRAWNGLEYQWYDGNYLTVEPIDSDNSGYEYFKGKRKLRILKRKHFKWVKAFLRSLKRFERSKNDEVSYHCARYAAKSASKRTGIKIELGEI